MFFRPQGYPRSPSRYFSAPRSGPASPHVFSIPRGCFSDPPRARFPSYSFDPNPPIGADGQWNREGLGHAAVRGDKLFCRPLVKSHRRLLQNKMKLMRCLGPRVTYRQKQLCPICHRSGALNFKWSCSCRLTMCVYHSRLQPKAFSWTACSVAAYVRTLDLLRSAGDSDRLEEEASTRMCGLQQFVIVPVTGT